MKGVINLCNLWVILTLKTYLIFVSVVVFHSVCHFEKNNNCMPPDNSFPPPPPDPRPPIPPLGKGASHIYY